MKTTVSIYDFRREFQAIRPNNFSYEGLGILFDYLEEMEHSCAHEIELDVIAICCDFSEDHWSDVAESYGIDLSDCVEDEEKIADVISYLDRNGYGHCGITEDGAIIYQQF